MTATHFDVAVIGAGSGGLAFARRAAKYGRRAVIFDHNSVGGTCVNRGCVPKKHLWFAAERWLTMTHSTHLGFSASDARYHYPTLRQQRDAYINRIHQSYQNGFAERGTTFISGEATLADERTVVCGGNRYHADTIVIAVGGRPLVPDVSGASFGITSDDFFLLDTIPARVAVIGSGYIACELAGVLHCFGSDVQLFCRSERLLRGFDDNVVSTLTETMRNDGIDIHFHHQPTALVANDDGSRAVLVNDKRFDGFDHVIWAIGRVPQTAPFAQLLSVDDNGFIVTDTQLHSGVGNIYALGDCTDMPQLTPVAIANAKRLADHLFADIPFVAAHADGIVPSIVFTHPPLGKIGLTEAEARRTYGGDAVCVYTSRFVAMVDAGMAGAPRSHFVIICVGDDERVVGMHAVGHGVDELMQGFAVAMRRGICKRDLDNTIAIHPTSAEEFVSTHRRT